MKNQTVLIALLVGLSCLTLVFGGILIYKMNHPTLPLVQPAQTLDKNGRPIPTPYERNEVKNTILKNAASVQACYNEFLTRTPVLSNGTVKLDWQITPEGKVTSPGVVLSELNDDVFKKCLISQVEKWNFPPPPNGTSFYVAHLFHFKKEETKSTTKSVATPP